MNSEQVLAVMGHIDPALIEMLPTKRKQMPRTARLAVIAACLCAALAGTAFAVEAVTGFSIVEFFAGETFGNIMNRVDPDYQESVLDDKVYSGYVAVRGNKSISLESVPEEIVAKVKDTPYTLFDERFNSWNEAEEYFNLNLYDNEYLEQMNRNPYTPCSVMYSGDEEGIIYITMNSNFALMDAGVSTDLEALAESDPNALNALRAVDVSVSAEVFREGYEQPDIAYFYPEGSVITQETYVFGDGLEAELLHVSQPDTAVSKAYTWHCVHFNVNGVRYYVSAQDESSEEYSLAVLKEVLAAFEFKEIS